MGSPDWTLYKLFKYGFENSNVKIIYEYTIVYSEGYIEELKIISLTIFIAIILCLLFLVLKNSTNKIMNN